MTIRQTVLDHVQRVAGEQGKHLPALHDDLVLTDTGLDSLCFAILVTRLEDELDLDPFSASDDAEFPVTLGQLVKSYENAAA